MGGTVWWEWDELQGGGTVWIEGTLGLTDRLVDRGGVLVGESSLGAVQAVLQHRVLSQITHVHPLLVRSDSVGVRGLLPAVRKRELVLAVHTGVRAVLDAAWTGG